ncbi:tmp1 [Nucleospora cyclopteri]
MRNYKFIVLEGIDNSGKTTISKILAEKMNAALISFPDRKSESGKKLDEFLRNYREGIEEEIKNTKLTVENKRNEIKNSYTNEIKNSYKNEINRKIHMLFSDNRREKAEFIEKTLEIKHVICDRYWISGAVYSTAKGFDWNWCKETDKNLPEADYTFFLDVKAEEAMKRGGKSREAHDSYEFQSKVYSVYKECGENMIPVKSGTIEEMVNEILLKINRYNKNSNNE